VLDEPKGEEIRMSFRLSAVLAAWAALACAILATPASAQLGPGEIVVTDRTADPDGLPGTGAVFRISPTTGVATVLAESSDFTSLQGIAVDASGNVLVADSEASPEGAPGDGAIFRIVPGQPPTVLATSADFLDPYGVEVDAAGNVLVADRNADPGGVEPGDTGTIFRFAPGNPPVVLEQDAAFVEPWDLAVDGAGNVLVADRDSGGPGGGILRFAPGQDAAPFATSPSFSDPSGVDVGPSGQTLVVDPDASPVGNPPFSGEISSVDSLGMVTPLTSNGFDDPFGVAIDASGRALVADSSADPGGAPGTGAVFRFTPGQTPVAFSTSPLFTQLTGVAVDPRSPPSATPPALIPQTSPPLTPKKCKKGQKLKKGKCVKKKRKKRKKR
jgi:hypothetical protein